MLFRPLILVIYFKKTDCTTKINEIEIKINNHDHVKCITTQEFNIKKLNSFTSENFASRLASANLAIKNDIANFVKKADFDDKLKDLNEKVTSNKTKNVLLENEFKKWKTFDSSLFIGQSYFVNDGSQNFLVFQSVYKTIKTFCGLSNTIAEWESKGLPNWKITLPFTATKSLSPKLVWMNNSRIRL